MIPLSNHIRGSIGIMDGLGLEEIFVDFTKLPPGLVLFSGDNGAGKSTFLTLCHPYLTVRGRANNLLQHQFYLEKSFRTFVCEHNGDIYTSKVLINGVTKKMEAYLLVNNKPIEKTSEGKLNAYREEVDRIFGSEKLFFNSQFSEQNKDSLAETDQKDLRSLFAELTENQKYKPYNAIAELQRKESEKNLTISETEKKTLADIVENITITNYDLNSWNYQKTSKEDGLKEIENSLNTVSETIENIKIDIARKEEKQNQNSDLLLSVEAKEKELAESENKYAEDISKSDILFKEKIQLFEADNPYKTEIELLKKKKENTSNSKETKIKEFDDNISAITKEIETLNDEISKTEKAKKRAENIDEHKNEIQPALDRISNLAKDSSQLYIEDNQLEKEKSEIEKNEREEFDLIRDKEDKNKDRFNKLNELISRVEFAEKTLKEKKIEFQKKIDKLNNDAELIDEVSCAGYEEEIGNIQVPIDFKYKKMGSTCKVLSIAYQNKENIPVLMKEFEEFESLQNEDINSGKLQIDEIQTEYDRIKAEISEERLKIKEKYAQIYADIKDRSERIAEKIKTNAAELAKLNEKNWEQLKKEADEADNNIKLYEERIQNFNKSLSEKEQSLKNLNVQKAKTCKDIDDSLKDIETQLLNREELMKNEKERMNNDYKEKKKVLLNNMNELKSKLQKEIDSLREKLSETLDEDLIKLKQSLIDFQDEKLGIVELQDQYTAELNELKSKIEDGKNQLIDKTNKEDRINILEARIKSFQYDLKEWIFLEEAYGPKGIPIIKIENSGPKITAIANELLSVFENRFRVKIRTQKEKADGKSLKEDFGIDIIDTRDVINDDEEKVTITEECDLKNKSGGQQVFVNSALHLAICLYRKNQNRNILTQFLDEADDGLSEANLLLFYKLLERVHKESGVFYTFVITHNERMKDLIPNKLVFVKGEGIKIETEAA